MWKFTINDVYFNEKMFLLPDLFYFLNLLIPFSGNWHLLRLRDNS